MNEHTLIDWCPLCGKHLGDKKIETRQIHDICEHPEYVQFQSETGKKNNGDDT